MKGFRSLPFHSPGEAPKKISGTPRYFANFKSNMAQDHDPYIYGIASHEVEISTEQFGGDG